ncbi:alpha/beta hydrolase [Cryobacterium sp. TMT1-2-1]|nr:alpha/beta hydrolase [Cryobacterium sp. TMT1-2-1]
MGDSMFDHTASTTRSGPFGARTGTRPPGTRMYGRLPGGLPFLSLGSGEPLVFLPGLGAHNEGPVGMERWAQALMLEPYAHSRRVWWVNRRPGLAPDATIADLAGELAGALRRQFGRPVDVLGMSTGGSVALQLAVDHPDVVKRLIIVSAAYRLGERGRNAQRRVAQEVQAERPRRAGAAAFAMLGAGPASRRLLGVLGWLLGRSMYGKATPDMIATIRAEDQLDLRDRLHEISAPTLVIGGERDAFYSEQLFTQTAALIPNSQLLLYEGQSHMGTSTSRNLVSDVLGFLDAQDIAPGAAPGRSIRVARQRDRATD